MKRIVLSFLAIVAPHSQCLFAQRLTILNPDSSAAVGVPLSFVPKGDKAGEVRALTDRNGQVRMPETNYPYRLNIDMNLYEPINERIAISEDRCVVLQERVTNMKEVVVTGQYRELAVDKAVQSIEVIDRRTIDRMAAQNLRDVLTNQLGVRLEYDAIFGSSMNMQGSKGYGADAKILIDGVSVVGKQNGATDLSQINLNNIERIEIVKGPMSVAYGTDAVAGTVNLITKKNIKDTWEAGVSIYYETIGTYNTNLFGGYRKGKHVFRFDGMRNFFGGWNPGVGVSFFDFSSLPADTNRSTLWKPREQYQGCLQYTYRSANTTLNYKGSLFRELITDRGAPLAPYHEVAIDDYFYTWRKDNALFLTTRLPKDRNVQAFVAYNAYKRIKKEVGADLTTLAETMDPEAQDTSFYNELNSRGSFNTTGAYRKVNYELGYDINIQYANSTQIEGRTKQMGNYALYGTMEYKPIPSLTIKPGLRYGYNTAYKVPVVPSANILYALSEHWQFRASYAKGFRQPGLKDLYFDFVDVNHNIHGNPGLRAESSDNIMASATYKSHLGGKYPYKVFINVYYNNVHDLITLVPKAGGTANEYWYENISQFYTKGLQASADANLGRFNLAIGSSLLGTYNQLSDSLDVPRFNFSPEFKGSIQYGIPAHDLNFSFFVKYTGQMLSYTLPDEGSNPVQTHMNSYTIADVTVSKSFFSRKLIITAGCKNLFNVTNVGSGMGSGGAHATSLQSAAIGTGRYYFFKTEFKFSN